MRGGINKMPMCLTCRDYTDSYMVGGDVIDHEYCQRYQKEVCFDDEQTCWVPEDEGERSE